MSEKTIIEEFETQVSKTPDHVALTYKEQLLTYKELNEQINQVAHYLLDTYDVGPGDYIGMIAKRSSDMIIGILGTLKSGAAFVPIDANAPIDRINYILKDCQPKAVLVNASKQALLEKDIPLVNLAMQEAFSEKVENPAIINQLTDLAYVIYTSGTTGIPKGVMVEHGSLANYMTYAKTSYITKQPVVPLFTNYTFDLTLTSIFLPFICGGKMIVYDGEVNEDIKHIFTNPEITFAKMTPSHLKMALFVKTDLKLNQLETLVLGGEALDAQLPSQIIEKYGAHIKIHNEYGPTEATIGCCDYIYQPEDDNRLTVPIGRPISNTHIYIMNAGGNLCGMGMTGELCIGGVGVARGYLNNAALTKEKFIPNPYGGGKLYLTGDLAKWTLDGNLEYQGRMDDQIKIRGYRIEIGEVESSLRKLTSITDAAVIVKKDNSDEEVIYAYFTARDELDIGAIKNELGRLLPEYMIPSSLFQIERIPLNANGKIDREALSEIEINTSAQYVAPQTEMEELIAHCYEEILGISLVGREDDFFDLGGHSLRALKLENELTLKTSKQVELQHIFEFPKVYQLAQHLEKLDATGYTPIPKATEKKYYEMSSTQKRIYLIQNMDLKAVTYNTPQCLKLIGDVYPEKIERALQQLIDRHEILRTAFIMVEGELMQRIEQTAEVEFAYMSEAQGNEETWLNAFVKPFNLSKKSQLRAKLINASTHYLLLLDMHHIISDGMSMSTFINEFITLYNGGQLEALTHQFKDYSEWMKQRDLSSQKDYWVGAFSDEIPVLDLPLDDVRPKQQNFEGAIIHTEVDHDIAHQIRELAGLTGSTAYMVFLASAMVLLGKYANQDDVVIGCPISGRSHKDTEQMLGMFVNTLAMRGKPEKEKCFKQLLEEVKVSSLKSYEHGEYPFEELIEHLDIKRDLSRHPLFDVMLTLQNNEELEMSMDGVLIQYAGAVDSLAKFDLTFHISEMEENYGIALQYGTALFKEETAKLMLGHYVELLKNLLEEPTAKLKEISLLTEREKHLILETFNDTHTTYPKEATVVQLFEEQVAKVPDHIAVVLEDKEMTYQMLNKKANALAHQLRDLDVAPDHYVAIVAEKSIDMIIGMLAILKSGAAYVPLDATYPTERMNAILEDFKPKAFLMGHQEMELEVTVPVLKINSDTPVIGNDHNLENINKSNDLAYLIYTSGTTGRPKGVMVTHQNVTSLIRNTNYVNFKDISIGQTGSLSFDAATFEIWGPLLNGGRVVLIPEVVLLNPMLLKAAIIKAKINTMFVTTALYNQLINIDASVFDSLTQLLFGGEATSEEHVKTLVNRNLALSFSNIYGPTESTTFSLYYPITKKTLQEKTPIGRPTSNTQAYIMNEATLCGIGMQGELCIAGAGIARGYLNQPTLTKEKFIRNPFGEGQLYKTGDLARWLPDGNIEYLRRVDDQVKVRGFRIELGEIESFMRKMAHITDAVAIVRADAKGEKAIYAYYTTEASLSVEAIQSKMQKALPTYMIPSYMKQVDQIPMTPNGKLDKNALPDIEVTSKAAYVAPKTAMEKLVATSYEEVLATSPVGREDHFFALGGHSLRALKLAHILGEKANKTVEVKHIFEAPKVSQLASLLAQLEVTKYERIPQAIKQDLYEMSGAQKRMYLSWRLAPTELTYNMPAMFCFKEAINEVKIQKAFEKMIARHEILRTTFKENVDGKLVQVILETSPVHVMVENARESLLMNWYENSVQCFDLEKGPLYRFKIAKTEDANYLFIDMHHIISDGMSNVIFVQEFNQLVEGVALQPLEHQYKDYSEWLKDQDLSEAKKYWINHLAAYPILELPTDFTRPKQQQTSGATRHLIIDEATTHQVRQFIQKYHVTEYMFFLGLISILIGKLSNQEELVIGTPISGRIHKDTENMLGMFVNTLAIKLSPPKDKTFAHYLDEIKKQILLAQKHQAYPFEDLVGHVIKNRDSSRHPLFDVMVTYQNNEEMASLLGTSEWRSFETSDKEVAKFDLSFTLSNDDKQTYLSLNYAKSLFKEETIKTYLKRLMKLLELILAIDS